MLWLLIFAQGNILFLFFLLFKTNSYFLRQSRVVSLCSPISPYTHGGLFASASLVLGLQVQRQQQQGLLLASSFASFLSPS